MGVNWRWADVNDGPDRLAAADMGDLLVKGDRPAPGTVRGWTVPGGTNEGAWRTMRILKCGSAGAVLTESGRRTH